MKMTIVLDTDDIEGLQDAYKIASMLSARHVPGFSVGGKVVIGKIALIKFLRAYGHECEAMAKEAAEKGEKPRFAGLRETKRFIEARWEEFQKA